MVRSKTTSQDEKRDLAWKAYGLYNLYDADYRNHVYRPSILEIRSKELHIDNESYDLEIDSMDFGIDIKVRSNGRIVFTARGPHAYPSEFRVFRPGPWQDKIKSLYKKIQRN